MPRGLDHIVHAVRDLDAAAALYRGLGFTVGARNRHSRTWGTQNHIVQLPDTFIELLAVTSPEGIVPHGPRHFSFGAFNRDFLVHAQGLSMLVLKGRGAADVAEFAAKGIGDFALYEFERTGMRPDGTTLTAWLRARLRVRSECTGCRLLHLPASPSARKFLECGIPEARQRRVCAWPASSRSRLNPSVIATFMQAFADGTAAAIKGGFRIDTPRGALEAIDPRRFHRPLRGPGTRCLARTAAGSDPVYGRGCKSDAGYSGACRNRRALCR